MPFEFSDTEMSLRDLHEAPVWWHDEAKARFKWIKEYSMGSKGTVTNITSLGTKGKQFKFTAREKSRIKVGFDFFLFQLRVI